MNPSFRKIRAVLLPLALLLATASPAQDSGLRLEGVVSGEGGLRVKIAIPNAASDAAGRPEIAELVEAVREDLDFSGVFDVVDPGLYSLVADSGDEPKYEDWISIGADALVRMRISFRGERIDLEARLYDNAGGSLLFGRRYGGTKEFLRRVAHQLSDDLVRHYTGSPGSAMTRIAFVSKHEDGKEVYLMDFDGHRIRRLTTTGTINLSPVWSPDGNQLAFVSWRGKQPGVYVISSQGEFESLATLGGDLSSAPDWSADGRKLAYSSDFHGNTELYVLDKATARNTRLTRNPAIDTSPAFSPTGREIAFTSDRTGSPQIYLMDAEGLNVRRISWNSNYNDSPAWSPHGDRLAYVSRYDGRFDVVVLDLSTDRVTRLTRGHGNSENPRWSPDGRHIVFASNRSGSYDIYTMRSDGSDVRRLTKNGNSYTPDWSR